MGGLVVGGWWWGGGGGGGGGSIGAMLPLNGGIVIPPQYLW